MKALVFHKPGDVRVDNVDDPSIEKQTDAILRVTSTAICGSDLHIYNGMFPQATNHVLGHEFMGIVEEVGREVTNLKRGDRVVVPFPIACGSCFFCQHQLPGHCENSNDNYGPEGGLLTEKGGGLFGYTDLYGGYAGGQAEYVRVPYANVGPRKVPDTLTDEQILFTTDIFPTGYTAIDWADMKGGESVAVFGCGPVGLMAQKVAWLKGASQVIALDVEEYRLAKAATLGASTTINAKRDDDAIKQIRALTGGRGADVVVDAVGMEADRSIIDRALSVIRMEKGTINALRMCFEAVRRGGVVSVVGVYGMPYDNFPLHQIFDKGITLKMGQAPVHKYIDYLMNLVQEGTVQLDDIITHHLPLEKAPHAYKIFNEKKEDCVKVVLTP
jgi:S-(hydroxymethyl)glutathione dehydrogenase / alcohol dehydrogenase